MIRQRRVTALTAPAVGFREDQKQLYSRRPLPREPRCPSPAAERRDGTAQASPPAPGRLRTAPTAHTGPPPSPPALSGLRRSPPVRTGQRLKRERPAGEAARAALPRRCPLTSEAPLVPLQGLRQGGLPAGRPHADAAGSRGSSSRRPAPPAGNSSSSTRSAFPRSATAAGSRKNHNSHSACGDPLRLFSVGRCYPPAATPRHRRAREPPRLPAPRPPAGVPATPPTKLQVPACGAARRAEKDEPP